MNAPKICSWRLAFVSLAAAVLFAGPALAAQKAGPRLRRLPRRASLEDCRD